MIIELTLTGDDLIQLIESKISQEVSKHGHPGTFQVEIIYLSPSFPKGVPLRDSVIPWGGVRAVATSKAP